jgi:hypothetical protein
VNREPNAGTGKREAQVTVDLRDTGLFVALRRRSSFGAEKIGEEETVTELGRSTLTLANGTYEVLLRDRLFGWNSDRIEAVEVPTGAVMTLVATRDFARYSPPAADGGPIRHNQFRWNGKPYRLTPAQSACIDVLLKRYAAGTFTATADDLNAAAFSVLPFGSEANQDVTIEGVLRNTEVIEKPQDFDRPVSFAGDDILGPLVVRAAEAEGTFQLATAEVARCRIDIRQPLLTVTVTNSDMGERVSSSGVRDIEYGVSAGTLSVYIGDPAVGWRRGYLFAAVTFGEPRISRNASGGERIDVVASRDAAYLRQIAATEIPEPAYDIQFRWFALPESDRGFGREVERTYQVDQAQAECIKVLLRALADGSPILTEQEMLSAAKIEGRTFAEVFGLALKEDKDRWTGLLSPGDREGTWQLTPPPEGMVDLGPDTATLDRLVQLAEDDLQAAEMRHESGTSSTGEVHEARLKLAEAKLRRAAERADQDLQRRLLEEIVAIRTQQLEIVQTQHERGTVPATAVREAEAALLEAQARLEGLE